jgi:hypothetical protein
VEEPPLIVAGQQRLEQVGHPHDQVVDHAAIMTPGSNPRRCAPRATLVHRASAPPRVQRKPGRTVGGAAWLILPLVWLAR